MGDGHRDFQLEIKLQNALESGSRVWAVGDIHGHIDTLKTLISDIRLGAGDQLVSLGDMIDRGPYSSLVLEMFRNNPSLHAVKEIMSI